MSGTDFEVALRARRPVSHDAQTETLRSAGTLHAGGVEPAAVIFDDTDGAHSPSLMTPFATARRPSANVRAGPQDLALPARCILWPSVAAGSHLSTSQYFVSQETPVRWAMVP